MKTLYVDKVDAQGNWLDTIPVPGSVFTGLFPKQSVVIISWPTEGKRGKELPEKLHSVRYSRKSGRAMAELDDKSSPLHSPNDAYGTVKEYFPYAWGSGIKQGETYGLTFDPKDAFRTWEDAQRFGGWALPVAHFGCTRRKLKVLVVDEDWRGPGWERLADGMSLLSKEVYDSVICREQDDLIELGTERGSYVYWNWLRLSNGAKEELSPLLHKRGRDIVESDVLTEVTMSDPRKLSYVVADPLMGRHKYIAARSSRSEKTFCERTATTVPIPQLYRVVVPTRVAKYVIDPSIKRATIMRYPPNGRSSVQTYEPEITPEYLAEYETISKMVVGQWRFSARTDQEITHVKGDFVVADCGSYDVITLRDNIKMGKAVTGEYDLFGFVSFTQVWKPGCAVGVDPEVFKLRHSGDFDGDTVSITDLSNFPETWACWVKDIDVSATNVKVLKNQSPVTGPDVRERLALESMGNLIGSATTLQSKALSFAEWEALPSVVGQPNLWDEIHKAMLRMESLFKAGLPSAELGPDGYPARGVDREKTKKTIFALMASLDTFCPVLSPWATTWKENAWFDTAYPIAYQGSFGSLESRMGKNGIEYRLPLTADMAKVIGQPFVWVPYWHISGDVGDDLTGTVAWIAKIMAPYLWERSGVSEREKFGALPLTDFRDWAILCGEDAAKVARKLDSLWVSESKKISWSNPADVARLKHRLNTYLDGLPLDHWEIANSLWWLVHDRDWGTANAVFFFFPEECLRIIKEKPGLSVNSYDVKIVGITKRYPDFSGRAKGTGVIQSIPWEGRTRRVLVAKLSANQKDYPGLPVGTLGFVASDSLQPPEGRYKFVIVPGASASSWEMSLSPA